jgi:hypothetical protein
MLLHLELLDEHNITTAIISRFYHPTCFCANVRRLLEKNAAQQLPQSSFQHSKPENEIHSVAALGPWCSCA